MADTVIFVENSSNIQKLLSGITNIGKTRIISCDIFSHDILTKLKIDHEKIEHYITESDQNLIDKLIIEKSHEWYEQKGISELLEFENLNLGSLLELEIASYFLQIMKNFIGVKRIIDKENPSIVISSTLLTQMVKTISFNKKIKTESYTLSDVPTLSYDRIALSINVGKKLFTIWVSRDFALKIKNTLESITSLIFKFKYDFSNPTRRKSVLLLDFNPMLYGDLLEELSKLDKDILLLNQRRPAVWNFQSLTNVKKSNSKVIKLENFHNSQLSSEIAQKQKELQKRLQKMLLLDNVLTKFFSMEGYSFWPSMKNGFIEMCSKRFNEIIEKFVLSRELIKKMNISYMLILYHTAPEEKLFIHVASEFKIPGIILQHGILTKRDTGILASILPFVPPIGIKHGLWGKESEDMFCQMGVKNEDIILTGNPRYDELFRIKNKCKNKNTILLGSSILSELAYSRIDTNMLIKFKNIFQEICKISVCIPTKKLIVKLHPGQHSSYDIKPILKEIDPSVPVYKTNNIIDLMKNCDVLIYIGYSTVLLEAMILNKPTITFKIGPDWDYEDKLFQSGATVLVTTISEFEEALNKILFDETYRNDLIQKGAKYINDYFTNQGNSSKFLTSILQSY